MRQQIEGSQAVAQAVALSRPEVICAYPISPADAHRKGRPQPVGEIGRVGSL
jgi:pyruvate ferredoxin oxidoreductase alpha subunit